MSFMTENKVLWRILILVMMVISLMGPWAFDLLNVPAEYSCGKPSVRLYGDFCGSPISGFGVIKWANSGFIYILDELVKGNIAGRIVDFIFPLYTWILILPFFSMLLLIWNKNSHRLQIINLVVWGLACLITLTMYLLQAYRDQFVNFWYILWGIWLYILVAFGAIIFEIALLRSNTKLIRDI